MLWKFLERIKIGTKKKEKHIPTTVNELQNNFQKPWNYNFELAPMSHVFTDYCQTTPSEDIRLVLENITDPKEREEFLKELEDEYNAIQEHYDLYPQD